MKDIGAENLTHTQGGERREKGNVE